MVVAGASVIVGRVTTTVSVSSTLVAKGQILGERTAAPKCHTRNTDAHARTQAHTHTHTHTNTHTATPLTSKATPVPVSPRLRTRETNLRTPAVDLEDVLARFRRAASEDCVVRHVSAAAESAD